MEAEDPRVYFAAERTMLAWVRTGVTVMGLGFVVARFGLFLSLLRGDVEQSHIGSTLIGVGLVILGAVSVGVSAWQHVRFCRGLVVGPIDRPKPYVTSVSVWFAAILSFVGLVLAVYILVRSETG